MCPTETASADEADDEKSLEPRSGLLGYWDRMVGPTATAAEQGITLAVATLWTVVVCGYAIYASLGWSTLQLLVIAVMTFDLAGGVTAASSVSGRRWWHRAEKTSRDHLTFVAVHVHPFVLAALFPGVTWAVATTLYVSLLLASGLILRVGPTLRRMTALALFSLWVLFAAYHSLFPTGLEWFGTLLYLKLFVGHLVGDA